MKLYSVPRVAFAPVVSKNEIRMVHAAARKDKRSGGGKGFGGGASNDDTAAEQQERTASTTIPPNFANASGTGLDALNATPSSSTSSNALPVVGRNQIVSTCLQTSALIAVFGFGLHQVAPLIAAATHSGGGGAGGDENHAAMLSALLHWPSLPTVHDCGITAAVAAAVTSARLALLSLWPEFKESTDASNSQVLTPLSANPADIALVTVLPALAEELLFRGALIPAVSPDWKGVAVAGFVFGVLHVNGGRSAAFGVWAGGVGCVYGASFLATGNLFVPMVAHAAGNIASAAIWLSSKNGNEKKQ